MKETGIWSQKILWRREWLLTPVFLPGEFHGQRSLAGYTVHGVAKSRTWLHIFKPNMLKTFESDWDKLCYFNLALESLLSWNSRWWSQSLARGPARLMCLTTLIDLPIPLAVPKIPHLLSWVFSLGVPELYSSENSAYLQVVHYLTEKYFIFIINSTTLKGS